MNSVFKWALVWMWFVCAATVIQAAPATNATRQPQPERWLLVVETSAAMEKRAQAVAGVVGDLLASGINGELTEGDQIGIWTYNKKLFTGLAPMQTWVPGQSNLIARRSAQFISRQKFQDKPKLESVMPELNRLAKESRKMTILLFSDGSQRISGTPFDEAINSAYEQQKTAIAKTRMPLVTVLRAERGSYIGQNVSFAPWPIEFPPFKAEAEVKPTQRSEPKPAEKPKPIIGSPKPAVLTTNVLIIPPSPAAANPAPDAGLKPVPSIPVEPAPTVEPVQPKPAPVVPAQTTTTNPKPVELAKVKTALVEPAQSTPAVTTPPAAAPPDAVTPAPTPNSAPDAKWGLSKRKWLLILGMGCMWVAIVIALVMVRRSRRPQTASLITRSFDRNQR